MNVLQKIFSSSRELKVPRKIWTNNLIDLKSRIFVFASVLSVYLNYNKTDCLHRAVCQATIWPYHVKHMGPEPLITELPYLRSTLHILIPAIDRIVKIPNALLFRQFLLSVLSPFTLYCQPVETDRIRDRNSCWEGRYRYEEIGMTWNPHEWENGSWSPPFLIHWGDHSDANFSWSWPPSDAIKLQNFVLHNGRNDRRHCQVVISCWNHCRVQYYNLLAPWPVKINQSFFRRILFINSVVSTIGKRNSHSNLSKSTKRQSNYQFLVMLI